MTALDKLGPNGRRLALLGLLSEPKRRSILGSVGTTQFDCTLKVIANYITTYTSEMRPPQFAGNRNENEADETLEVVYRVLILTIRMRSHTLAMTLTTRSASTWPH